MVGAFGLLAGCAGSGAASSSQAEQQAAPQQQGDDENGDMKPFSEVIPDDADTDAGLLTTHQVDDKLYFEIPDSLFGREILMVSRQAKVPSGMGYGGQKTNTLVLHLQRRNETTVDLRVASYEKTANPDDAVFQAVQNSSLEPILRSFDVKALNEDSTGVVVNATDLFESDVSGLGLPDQVREEYRVGRLDGDRTYISGVESFPENTDIEAVLTYQAQEPPSNSSTGTITVEMNHSMVLLPEEPMQPRLCDDRVGYFSVEHVNFSSDKQKAAEECFITRWRLEPSDPEAYARGELVEPKDPIVYYIDPATPKKWRPYLAAGVEAWNKAFREAGFKNAIEARLPSEVDSTFDPDDVRYSTIRYFASDVQNAYGPHVHDPRSGEILESDIGWYHNVMNLLRNWYFVQTAAVNPQARGQTFDEDVMGKLIRFVSAHEVGHTLGLPHNMGSSNAVPVDSLRSPEYMEDHGTAPSIMDYARFNYVAQPGDGVTNFQPKVGIYDKWSVKWGYHALPDAGDTPEQEADVLDDMIKEKAGDPRYFFGESGSFDPRAQTEDLGRNVMEANQLGLENLKRTVPNLVEWTRQDGEFYGTVDELYNAVVNQWVRYMGHVGNHIGGVHQTMKTYDQEGMVYEPVSAESQREAMDFLDENAFQTQSWLVEADVLRRFEHAGAIDRIRSGQVYALNMVLDPQRMARLLEAEVVSDASTYTLSEMMTDLRESVWSELNQSVSIDPFRRNLQRGYLERMDYLLNEAEVEAPPEEYAEYIAHTPVDVSQSDIRPQVRQQLRILQEQVDQAMTRAQDEVTRMHLSDVRTRIDMILDPTATASGEDDEGGAMGGFTLPEISF